MKKSTMRLAVVSACVGAGLVLSACGGSGDVAETDTSAEEQTGAEDSGADESGDDAAAEDAAAPVTEDELLAAVEAGGFSAQVIDTGDASGTEAAAVGLDDSAVEPKECEVFMNAAAVSMDDTDITLVMGGPSDSSVGTFGGAIGYPSADDAAGAMKTSSGSLDTCGEMTVTSQGMEINSSITELDASVDGADEVFASEITMDMSGQSMTMTSLQALKGSTVVTVGASSFAGRDSANIDEMSATAADMIAALP